MGFNSGFKGLTLYHDAGNHELKKNYSRSSSYHFRYPILYLKDYYIRISQDRTTSTHMTEILLILRDLVVAWPQTVFSASSLQQCSHATAEQ